MARRCVTASGARPAGLLGWYDLQRGIVVLKCEGLTDADARRSVIPTSPLMTAAGNVSHLTTCEQLWFEHAFLGREFDGPGWDGVDDSEFDVTDRSLAEVLAAYDAQCRRSDEVFAAHDLDDLGTGGQFPAAGASLGWMLHHMLEETARHAGHLDLVRELLDGETSYY